MQRHESIPHILRVTQGPYKAALAPALEAGLPDAEALAIAVRAATGDRADLAALLNATVFALAHGEAYPGTASVAQQDWLDLSRHVFEAYQAKQVQN